MKEAEYQGTRYSGDVIVGLHICHMSDKLLAVLCETEVPTVVLLQFQSSGVTLFHWVNSSWHSDGS